MATQKYGMVRGKRFRLTTLDNCGRVTSSSTQVTGKGFVSIKLSAETEDGSEILQRDFTGGLCINERGNDSFKYFGLEIEMCNVDPDVMVVATNAKAYQDTAGSLAGFTVPEGELDKYFALEIWTGVAGNACADGSNEASGYLLLPFVAAGVFGEWELNGEDAVTFSLSNAKTKGGNNWGVGPYTNVMYNSEGTLAALPSALDPFDHLLMTQTTAPIPELTDKATAVQLPG